MLIGILIFKIFLMENGHKIFACMNCNKNSKQELLANFFNEDGTIRAKQGALTNKEATKLAKGGITDSCNFCGEEFK